jgi:hypothetical protein
MTKLAEEQMLKQYEKDSDKILKNMYMILARAQRKLDDKAYVQALSSVQ